MLEDPEVTTMSEKGQVVIPQDIRNRLRIGPKTKFMVTIKGNFIVMKKLELPDINKEWQDIFKTIEKKNLKITEKEISEEIKDHRKEEHKLKG